MHEKLRPVLDSVEAPPFDQVRVLAGTIRKRRRVAEAAAALAVASIALAMFYIPRGSESSLPAAGIPSPVRSYTGSGVTLHSLAHIATVPDLDGAIVEFDIDGSGVLRTDKGTWAQSHDGGQTWEIIDYTPQHKPTWQHANWTASRATPSGRKWAAGITADGLTLAWQDRNGEWNPIPAGGQGNNVTGTVAGEQVIVMSLQDNIINSVWRYDANGLRHLSNGGGMTISGEPILLPDGRLLLADAENKWQISSDQGATWASAGGDLPVVGSLRMTSAGYVALNLFRNGWVATSTDGLTWHKLPIR